MDDVDVLDEILFAFEPEFAGFLAFCFAAVNDEILVGDHLGANKAALDVAMNFAGGFWRTVPWVIVQARTSSSPAVKTDQIEQGVRGADKRSRAGSSMPISLLKPPRSFSSSWAISISTLPARASPCRPRRFSSCW